MASAKYVFNGQRVIGYVEPQKWEGNEQWAARITLGPMHEEFIGFADTAKNAVAMVKDHYDAYYR